MHACIVSCVRHGIGDELTLIGSLATAMLRAGWEVDIWTHHPMLYSIPELSVHDWSVEPLNLFAVPPCDLGLCFVSRTMHELPVEFDRTPLVRTSCERAGYRIMDGDGRDDGFDFDNAYDYASYQIESLGLRWPSPPWPFLIKLIDRYILFNPFGWGEEIKGLPPSIAWRVLSEVALAFAQKEFVVATVDTMPGPGNFDLPPNVSYETHRFGSPRLLERYLSAAAIITAEGGGYHVARAANLPALLVTSKAWYNKAKHAMPPLPRDVALFDQLVLDERLLSDNIISWINQNCFGKSP